MTIFPIVSYIFVFCKNNMKKIHRKYVFFVHAAAFIRRERKNPLSILNRQGVEVQIKRPVTKAVPAAASATIMSGRLKYARTTATAVPATAVMIFPVL